MSLYSTVCKNEHKVADGHLHYFLLHHGRSEDVGDMQGKDFLQNFSEVHRERDEPKVVILM